MKGILKLNKWFFLYRLGQSRHICWGLLGLKEKHLFGSGNTWFLVVPISSTATCCVFIQRERARERAYNGEGPNRARDSRFCVLVPVFLGKDARDGTEKRSLISQIRKSFVTYLSLTWLGMLDQKRSSWYICKPHSETFSWECMVRNLKFDVHYPRVMVEMNVK